MKSKCKTYVEPITFWLATVIILTAIIAPIIMIYALVVTENIELFSESNYLEFCFLLLIILICDVFLLFTMAPRGLATITLFNDRVMWRAPFRRSVTLKFDEIKYAGVDFSEAHISDTEKFKESQALYLSSYIYLSVLPYMPRRGKEFKKVYNEDGIIMFKYTEKLCPALVEKLPEDVVRSLKDFDNKIKKQHKKKLKNKE